MYSSSRVSRGRGELLAFLQWAHDGVREVIRPRLVLQEGNRLFVDVDMDFVCSKARPDFPFASLLPGDILTVRFFVTYTLDEAGLITELCSMVWPAMPAGGPPIMPMQRRSARRTWSGPGASTRMTARSGSPPCRPSSGDRGFATSTARCSRWCASI
jgi:hypothetical protein